MSGKKAETKPSPLEQATANEVKNYLFPAARDQFTSGAPLYQGTQLAGQSGTTLDNQAYVLNQLNPYLTGVTTQNINSLLGFMGQDVPSNEDILGRYGTSQDIFKNTEDLSGLYQNTVARENARAQNQIDTLINRLGRASGETFSRNILPQLEDEAAAAGQFGFSKQAISEGLAAGDVQSNLDDQIAGLLYQDLGRQDSLREAALNRAYADRTNDLGLRLGQYNTDVNRALGLRQQDLANSLQASGLLGGAIQSSLVPAGLAEGIGLTEDARLQAELNDYIQQYNAPYATQQQRINDYASIIFGAPQGTAIPQAGSGSPLLGALGGAATGAQIGSAVPGIGTAYGAAGGAIIGGLGTLLG